MRWGENKRRFLLEVYESCVRGGCSPLPGQGLPVLWEVRKRSGENGKPLPNPNLVQCHHCCVMSDIGMASSPEERLRTGENLPPAAELRVPGGFRGGSGGPRRALLSGARGAVGAVLSRGAGA